jgi:hypothetical protein
MTVKFKRWYGTPPEVHDLGHWADMSDGAVRLYGFLCRASDRRSKLRFELGDKEVADQSGVSKRRLGEARTDLTLRGLIVCNREPGARFSYTLCDLYKKQKVSPVVETLGHTHDVDGLDFCDVSFAFGWNVIVMQPPVLLSVSDFNPFSDDKRGAIRA